MCYGETLRDQAKNGVAHSLLPPQKAYKVKVGNFAMKDIASQNAARLLSLMQVLVALGNNRCIVGAVAMSDQLLNG